MHYQSHFTDEETKLRGFSIFLKLTQLVNGRHDTITCLGPISRPRVPILGDPSYELPELKKGLVLEEDQIETGPVFPLEKILWTLVGAST